MVDCAHGRFPVPAPATADLLRGLPTYSADIQKELVTPTGAAIIRAIDPIFSQQPAMRVEQIGYGAGTRNPKDFPNVLRISIGESTRATTEPQDTVTILETAIDDLSPQILAHVTETALAKGALDVMCTPVQMKKGRSAPSSPSSPTKHTLPRSNACCSARPAPSAFASIANSRSCLDRSHTTVSTPYGDIRIKVGTLARRRAQRRPRVRRLPQPQPRSTTSRSNRSCKPPSSAYLTAKSK